MINKEIKIVESIDDIIEVGQKYAHIIKPSKWIQIDIDEDNTFSVYGMISGDIPTFITKNSVIVKSWKTMDNLKKSLHIYSSNGSWGMRHWKIS